MKNLVTTLNLPIVSPSQIAAHHKEWRSSYAYDMSFTEYLLALGINPPSSFEISSLDLQKWYE